MKKILYIFISLIISLLVFNSIQTNRVYIKAVVKNDCTIEMVYTNLKNEETTVYKRIYKYSDEGIQKIKLRLKDNVKTLELNEKENSLDVKSVKLMSGFLPYEVKSFDIPQNVFRNIFLIRIFTSLLLGFVLTFGAHRFFLFIRTRKEKFMAAVFIFIFCMPLLTSFLPLEKINIFNLAGERVIYNYPKFTLKSYFNKSFQQQFESWFGQAISWNTIYIKAFNSLYYKLFDKSYSSDSTIIIGKDKYLYDQLYINTLLFPNKYSGQNNVTSLKDIKTYTETMSEDLKIIQDYFEKKGKTFIFVITPSKADFEETNIPERFEIEGITYQTYLHNILLNSLDKNKIKYVDTSSYLKKNGNRPVFANGGIHWNDYGKMLATNIVIKKLNQISKYKSETLKIEEIYHNKFPQNEDRDLISLLNILYLPKDIYTVENIIIKPSSKNAPDIKVKMVGGSFLSGICEMLSKGHIFKNIDYYFYINKKLITYRDFIYINVIDNETIKNTYENIKNAADTDILILELNDGHISNKNGHVTTFIREMKKIMAEDSK